MRNAINQTPYQLAAAESFRGLPDVMPYAERVYGYDTEVIEERWNDRKGLSRSLVVEDRTPPRCAVCDAPLYPPIRDFNDEADLDYWPTGVAPCEAHFDAAVIWPIRVTLTFEAGSSEPLSMEAAYSHGSTLATVSLSKLHRDTLPWLSAALTSAHLWLMQCDQIAAYHADRDPADECNGPRSTYADLCARHDAIAALLEATA